MPLVSVIVPVYNDVERLERCLRALAAQNYPPEHMEVLVVDNASTADIGAVMPDDARFTLLREMRPGSYSARNAALAVARGDIIAFTDADCVPAADWVASAVSRLCDEPDLDLIGGAIELFFASGEPRTAAEWYEARHGFTQEAYMSGAHFAATANMITRRRVLDEVGGFDATMMSGADADFGGRVHACGGRLSYCSEVVVHHPARATTEELVHKFRRTTFGSRDLILKAGGGRWQLLSFAGRQYVLLTRSFMAVVVLGRPPHSWVDKARYLLLSARLRHIQAMIILSAATGSARPAPR